MKNGYEVTGGECYDHSLTYFSKIKRQVKGSRLGTKGNNKRVRKPGDDELGIQLRLDSKTQVKKRKRGGKKRPVKGKKRAIKGGGLLRYVKSNAGAFLRKCDKTPWEPISHGAKMKAAIDLILGWYVLFAHFCSERLLGWVDD